MKIGIDIDGVILDYERVLKTYGDLYDFIELKKSGIREIKLCYLQSFISFIALNYIVILNKYT